MASVQCVEAFTMRVARMSRYRSHPLLAGGQSDDMVGVVVAHEIGHLLGLQHASKGVMRTRLDAEDIIAFRSQKRARTCGLRLRSGARLLFKDGTDSRELTPLDWHRRIAR